MQQVRLLVGATAQVPAPADIFGLDHPLAVHCQEHEFNPRAAPRFATAPSPMLSLLSNKSCPAPRRVVT
jgi:hypothetical protein